MYICKYVYVYVYFYVEIYRIYMHAYTHIPVFITIESEREFGEARLACNSTVRLDSSNPFLHIQDQI